MEIIGALFVLAVGLVFGSFVTCISYRLPIGKSIFGRSYCPKCHHKIAWYDNIPILSYITLGGVCRACKKKISIRYPLIEGFVALVFVVGFMLYRNCGSGGYYFCGWEGYLKSFTFPFLLFNLVLITVVFVIDLEHQIIPDEIVFLGWAVAILVFFIFDQELYMRLLSSFLSASLLLLLSLVTRGRGMGLGDVKFALYGGIFFTPLMGIFWLFFSFALGAVIGIGLILGGKAKLGKRIAFGPYLALALLFCLMISHSQILKFLIL